MTKAKSIETILKLTNKTGESKYFDKLVDWSESHLAKLLRVVKQLNKQK